MKGFKSKFLAVFIGLILIVVATTIFWWKSQSVSVSSDTTEVSFVIPRGMSASAIGNLLYKENLIKSPLAFKFYVQLTGKSENIQAGEFRVRKNMNVAEIVEAFSQAPFELWVTIPEGLRREEIPPRIIKVLEMDKQTAEKFTVDFLSLSKDKEGFLFPSTYLFPRNVSARDVVDKLAQTFDSEMVQFQPALADDGAAGGLDLGEIVTLASIIERETKTDEERPVVAGIYFNRMDLGMPLQADATVQYAIASEKCKVQSIKCENWWPILTLEDLKFDSQHNTYKYGNLPPAPIANPGISSIRAVIYPKDSDYLYYIHDPEGQIHYGRTLDEHNANISKYLR